MLTSSLSMIVPSGLAYHGAFLLHKDNTERGLSEQAIEEGARESTQSWREVLLNLGNRGRAAPKRAMGDGAMGFWAALEDILPTPLPAALLDAQERQCAQSPAQADTAQSQEDAA